MDLSDAFEFHAVFPPPRVKSWSIGNGHKRRLFRVDERRVKNRQRHISLLDEQPDLRAAEDHALRASIGQFFDDGEIGFLSLF